jgi:hypothetical protein
MNPQKMLKQMQKMQAEMERVQLELQDEYVSATTGGGVVTATVSGGLEVKSIIINPKIVDPVPASRDRSAQRAAPGISLAQGAPRANPRLGGCVDPDGRAAAALLTVLQLRRGRAVSDLPGPAAGSDVAVRRGGAVGDPSD